MPTALGALPSNKPIPNGRVQVNLGPADAPNHWTAADAGIALLGISVTPDYPCWWVIRTNMIVAGVNGGWQRWDYAITCEPADVSGLGSTKVVCDVYDSGTVGWLAYAGLATFRLAAGTAYTSYVRSGYSSGGTQQTWAGSLYSRMVGVTHGEGVV